MTTKAYIVMSSKDGMNTRIEGLYHHEKKAQKRVEDEQKNYEKDELGEDGEGIEIWYETIKFKDKMTRPSPGLLGSVTSKFHSIIEEVARDIHQGKDDMDIIGRATSNFHDLVIAYGDELTKK